MANFPSTYYTAQTAVSPRNNAPSADSVDQSTENAVLTVTIPTGSTIAATDFAPLMRIVKPGMQVIPEKCRIRCSVTSNDLKWTLQYIDTAGTATNLSAESGAMTNAVITLASPSATTLPPTLAVGGYLRLDPSSVTTGAAATYQVELEFRVAGGH
jgi:hypothetical protein